MADVHIWASADGSTADVYVRKYEFIFNDLFLSFVITVTHWQPPYSNFWEDHKTITIRDTAFPQMPIRNISVSPSLTSQRYEFAISIKLDREVFLSGI